jgi:hypothetical protein
MAGRDDLPPPPPPPRKLDTLVRVARRALLLGGDKAASSTTECETTGYARRTAISAPNATADELDMFC